MTSRQPWGVRSLVNVLIFVVSGAIVYLILDVMSYFHGNIEDLNSAARTALEQMQPGQLLSQFRSIQDVPLECRHLPTHFLLPSPSTPLLSSRQRSQRDNTACPDEAFERCLKEVYTPYPSFEFVGMACPAETWQACFGIYTTTCTYRQALLSHEVVWVRWTHAVYFLITDIFQTESRPQIAIAVVQLLTGWLIAFTLSVLIHSHLGTRSFPYLFVVPVLGIVVATVVTVPILWIIRGGSAFLGMVIPNESDLTVYGATISTICCGCTRHVTETGLHSGVERLIEGIVGQIKK